MSLELIFFLVLALASVVTAFGMLLSRNAIYSALYLVMNFITVAIFYLMLGAPFIAMAQITVYAGAIMVLFLFVIMLLGAERLPDTQVLPYQKWLARVLAFILVVETGYMLLVRGKPQGEIIPPEASANMVDSLREMGMTLFNEYLLPFEVTSVLLLVAMVGAIVLIRKDKKVG
ncbi:MAG: NADH-quinone oxidoreductase subunit J [Anaerolineales bacterium]|nr:NADH-quinone oxidoreductase subunit J [Anaerolineae bacterium]PWB70268.1 MAG: NADH-quinone oxidoreductase subunit J [Anaerolineales bacterium]